MEGSRERTADVFERIEGYREPPLIALPDFSDPDALRQFGLGAGLVARGIFRSGIRLAGWNGFARRLESDLEPVLRRSDFRGYFNPPLISASMLFRDDPRALTPYQRAASLVVGSLSLRRDIATAALPQDEYKGQPLEMGQYPNLFSTSMIVEEGRLRLHKAAFSPSVIVAVRGELSMLDVEDQAEKPDPRRIARELEDIASSSRSGRDSPCALSAAWDEKQVEYFTKLEEFPENRRSLELLRRGLFTLCLDLDSSPESPAEALRLAHSGNYPNRWYSSSLQIVVFGNGMAAAVCSFRAWLDGNAMSRGGAEIQRRAERAGFQDEDLESPGAGRTGSTRTEWRIDPELVAEARSDLARIAENDENGSFYIPGIGQAALASTGLAPVPLFVVALAIAVRRSAGRLPAIKQFVALSKYRCVGVDAVLVTTPELARFIELLSDEAAGTGLLKEALSAAVASQDRECRLARRSLSIEAFRRLFHFTLGEAKSARARKIEKATLGILRRLRLYREPPMDILVSHPALYPEIPLIGRPGVRMYHIKYMTLHYLIWRDSISCTLCKGSEWEVPNRRFAEELKRALAELCDLAKP
jgi:hypothetical protein